MTLDQARKTHALVSEEKWEDAANYVMALMGKSPVGTRTAAVKVLQNLFQYLLDNDMYLQAATLQWGPDMFNTEPESTVRVFKALEEGSLVLLMGASSMSKCVKFDQPILKYDGTTVPAYEIKVGDQLMGDDSGPRNVEVVNPGFGPMYRIIPERGEPW